MNVQLSNIELQAEILRQNHRWFSVIRNYWVERKKFEPDDPRYIACRDALAFKIVGMLIPTTIYTTLGISTIVALIISIQTLLSIQEQNIIESRAFLFEHAREIQKIFLEYPELYPYFYSNKEIPSDITSSKRARINTIAEMLADMLDNAAGSRIKDLSEGWSEYANYMYNNGPAFRNFYNENIDWYPEIDELLKMRKAPKKETFLDKIKKAIGDL